MDLNDRARGSGSRNPRGGGTGGTGNTIKGPHSALTDYLQEIGVSRHFRDRRRAETAVAAAAAEAAAAAAHEQVQRQEQQPAAAVEQQPIPNQGELEDDSADAALARDLQDEENIEAELAESGVGTSRMATRRGTRQRTVVVSIPVEEEVTAEGTKGKGKGRARGRKKKKDSDSEDGYGDEADQRGGLNRSSARKGGQMKICEVCEKRFLLRGEHKETDRLLCPNCRRSVEKSQNEAAAVSKRARMVASTAAPKRRRLKKTADGLLELEPGLPTLQDLCVRAIAKHVDQVESFGDI
ncbi:UV-damaged DNA-binding protein rad7, partial [Coemansia furcata]